MASQSECERCFDTYVVSFTYISALQPFWHHGTPDILSHLSWNPR